MRGGRWPVVAGVILASVVSTPPALAGARSGLAGARSALVPATTPASPWPSMRHDRDNTGASPIAARYRGDRPWAFRTGRGLFITPVIGGNGTIYFGSADHSFYAVAHDGRLRWKFTTGNIIDAAAALDPSQRTVTIGSGDENLYHLSTNPRPLPRRRRVIWRYHATLKPATGQLVDWWEGDIAYGPDGNLYTGNTGGVVYSFTPSGRLRWTFRAGNSVWTMPAFGPGGVSYYGSVDRSVFALGPTGSKLWGESTLGFVTSSPAIGSDGTIYIGSFDSKLYALDPRTGAPKWTFGTNDSIYSSPALGRNAQGQTDAIYVASTDGSVYALSPAGRLLWTYDTGEAIRSSPVLGAGPGGHGQILYVGSSDGSLYALDAATGRRRWSFDTVSTDPILRDRHELNSSPALGRTGVYIGSEDGHLWYIPYDYCLHRHDPRCTTSPGEPYAASLTRLFPVTAGGTTVRSGTEGPVPSSAELTARLMVRRGGKTVYAAMIPSPNAAALIHTQPRFSLHAELSGDGRYIFITPTSTLKPDTTYQVRISGRWGADGTRVADYTLPGTWTRFGRFSGTIRFRTAGQGRPLPFRITPGRVTAFELRRLALPLPAFLPSVNQIGFDSYVLLVGAIRVRSPHRGHAGSTLLWATQGRQLANGTYGADPHGTLVFPLAGTYRGSTLQLAVHRATLTFSFGTVPLELLDVRFAFGPSLVARPGASIYAEAQCDDVPNYGKETVFTGICNARGTLAAAGTFITNGYPARGMANRRPRGVSVASVTLRGPTPKIAGSLTATIRLAHGARYRASQHRIGLLLVNRQGQPVGLDYTDQVTRTDRAGNVSSVRLALPAGTRLPPGPRVYVLADVFPLFTARLG
jgi:outer membrane protein assembly factor BamB